MGCRARPRSRPRDRRERGGGVRSRALWHVDERDLPTRVAAKDLYVGAAGVALGARRAAPPRPRGRDDRPRRRRAPHARVTSPDDEPQPVLRRGGTADAWRYRRTQRRARRPAASRACARTRRTKRMSSCGARPERCSSRTRCTSGPATTDGATPGPRAPTSVRRRRDEHGLWTQHLRHGAAAAHARRGPRRRLEPARAPPGGSPLEDARDVADDARAERDRRGTARQLADRQRADPSNTRAKIRVQWCHGAPGIVTSAASYLPEELLARRRGAHVAGRPPRQGTRPLSRHRGQRLRAPEGVRANRRRALAQPSAALRDARARAGRAPRPRQPLALQRRHRRRAVRRRLPRRAAHASRFSTAGASSPVLYRPEDFEPLTEDSWDAERVREAIRTIVAHSEAAFDPDDLWPTLTSETSPTPSPRSRISTPARRAWRSRSTHCAAAATQTSASTSPARRSARSSCGSTLRTTPTTRRSRHRATRACSAARPESSRWRFASHRATSWPIDCSCASARTCTTTSNELVVGPPGTMLAAHAMHAWTGERALARCLDGERRRASRRRRDADGTVDAAPR